MKQFKRTISILLAAAMLATVLCTGMAVTAMAADNTPGAVVTDEAGFNLIKNPGFENHDSELQDWGSGNVTLNTDAAYVHSGIRSAKISAATPSESYAYNVSTTDNIVYDVNGVLKVGMWVYLTNAEDASKVTVYIERPESDGNRSVQPEAKTGWQKVMLTTNGVSGCIRNAIKISVAADTAGDVYFDDAFIMPVDMESIEFLYNNGFERGDGWAGETAYVSENVRSGAYAMKLSAGVDIFQSLNWHWYGKQMNTGRTLRYSFWVRGGSDDGSIWLNAEVKYGDGQVMNCTSNAVTGYAGDWTLLSVDAPAPDGAVTEIVLHIITEGSGDYFVDDGSLRTVAEASAENRNYGVVVTGITGINLVDNAGFEESLAIWGSNSVSANTDTSYTHSGASSAKVAAGQAGEAYAYSIPSATYNRNGALKAGMWVYLTDADDASRVTIVMERNSDGGTITAKPEARAGWQRVEIDAPETTGADHHAIKFVVSAGNVADIYFDDAFIYCMDAESINIVRNGGFESNKDAWADAAGFEIVSDVSRSGAAAKLTGEVNIFQASGWWPNKSSADTGDALYYSAWVKGGENAGAITLRAEVKSSQTQNYISSTVTGATDDWQLLVVKIPYPNEPITELLLHISATGEGVFYVDDVTVNAVEVTTESLESPEDKTAGVVVVGFTGINLMDNPGFENSQTNLDNWGFNEAVSVNTDTVYTHSGAVSAKVSAGHTGDAFAYCNTSASYNLDAEFTFGMWVYLAEAEDAQYVTIYLERPDSIDGTVTVQPEEKAGWQRVVWGGGITEGTARQAIKFVVREGHSGDIYFDDAFVYCADAGSINIIRNGSFESNKDTWADNPGFAIVSDVSRSGAAAKLTGEVSIFQASGWWPNKASVNSGETLYYSAWVKSGENAGSITLRAEVKAGATMNYYSKTVSGATDGWKLLVVEIPYPDVAVTEILFHITTTGEGVFYVDDAVVNNEKVVKARWVGHSMALGTSLDMRFHVTAMDDVAEDVIVKFNDQVYTLADAVKNVEPGTYYFVVSLAAAQLNDVINAEMWVDGELCHTGNYTVKHYAEGVMQATENPETIMLLQTMLSYGGKAQNYFGYNTENPADAGIALTDMPVPGAADYECQAQGSVDGIRFYGATLLFRSKTVIRYYFVADNGVSGYTATVDGAAAQWNEKDGMYYVEVTVENPAVLDELHTVTVQSGSDAITVSYSGMHYVARMYNKADSSQELKELVQAMYNYHKAAQAYQK